MLVPIEPDLNSVVVPLKIRALVAYAAKTPQLLKESETMFGTLGADVGPVGVELGCIFDGADVGWLEGREAGETGPVSAIPGEGRDVRSVDGRDDGCAVGFDDG